MAYISCMKDQFKNICDAVLKCKLETANSDEAVKVITDEIARRAAAALRCPHCGGAL
jgi:hypothetical protein